MADNINKDEKLANENSEALNKLNNENSSSDDSEYEKICYLCRRTESVAGAMVSLPGGLSVCTDCLQKTLDTISSANFDFNSLIPPGFNLSGFGISGLNPNGSDDLDESEDSDESKNELAETDENSEDDGKDKKNKNDNNPFNRRGEISFINLADFQGGFGGRQKVKKKKKSDKPLIDLKDIPAPHKIKEQLDEYVIGQDYAKKVMSVAVYNHYKRVATNTMKEIEIEKSNIMMIGPTGSGKTYLVRTLAKILDVPLAIADATSLTEAGYIGDDVESVISKLLMSADNDVEKAEMGIVFIDEIDKLARKRDTTSRDVNGESVQQGLLKLLEGSEIEVPVGASSKNAMVPMTTIDTRNILFIVGGAFPDLEDILKERLNKNSAIGFQADLKDKFDEEENLIKNVTTEDLRKYGMIPEFLGRLPIICTLEKLTKDMLIEVLKEPKNAILKQYQKLLELDEVQLVFDDSALEVIAEKAVEKNTGARALRAIIEEFMLDIMYEIPKDINIGKVTITRDYIENKGAPIIELRTQISSSLEASPVASIEEKNENDI